MNAITGSLLLLPKIEYPKGIQINIQQTKEEIIKWKQQLQQYQLIEIINKPLIWIVSLLLFCRIMNSLLIVYSNIFYNYYNTINSNNNNQNNNNINNNQLMDIIFEITPIYTFQLSNTFLLTLFSILTFLRFFFTPIRITIFRRYCFIKTVCILFQSGSIYSTLLYTPNHTCNNTYHIMNLTDYYSIIKQTILISIGYYTPCIELLFSDFIMQLTLNVLLWFQYVDRVSFINPFIEKVFALCFGIICVINYSLQHIRYSCDCFIGITLTVLVFSVYHFYIKSVSTRNNFFNAFMRWFEEDSNEIPKLVKLASKQMLLYQ